MIISHIKSLRDKRSPLQHFAEKERKFILGRYIAIYTIYLLVLILVLFAGIGVSRNMMEQKTVRVVEERVRAAVEELEVSLEAYERAAVTIMNSEQMRALLYSDNLIADAYIAYEYYVAVTQSLENLPDCGYILKNETLMTSSSYYLNPESYFTNRMRCLDTEDYAAWYQFLQSMSGGSFTPAMTYRDVSERESQAILYLIRRSTVKNPEMFFVVIPIEHILNLISPSTQSDFGNINIYNNKRDVLTLYQSDQFSDEMCSRSITYTGDSGLTITVDIAQSYIQTEMEAAYAGFFLFTLLFILIGLIFTIAMAYHNTRPMAVLLRAANQYDTTGQFNAPTERIHREYKYLLSILSNSSAALKSYEKELERFASETQYWSFVGMLMGEDTDMARYLHRAPYALLLIAPESVENEACSLLLSLIRQRIDRSVNGIEFLCAFRNTVIILVEETHFNRISIAISELFDSLPNLRCRRLFVPGLKTITEIRDAYAQANCMLKFPPTDNTMQQGLKLAAFPAEYTNTMEYFTQFNVSTISNLLISGQIDTLTGMFDNFIAFFNNGGYADETSINHIYISCMMSLSVLRSKFADITADITVPEFTAFSSAEQMLSLLRGIMITVNERICSSYKNSNVSKTEEIMAFIEENVGNAELYSKTVMEKFGLSAKELQNYVKKATDMSFFHYVEKVRMERAKHLLLTTDRSLTEIREACGYNSNSVFNRAFSRFYGIPPMKMRKRDTPENQ